MCPLGSKISPELNKLNVTVVDNKKCKESYGDIIKETNICAIGLEGQGTCQVLINIIFLYVFRINILFLFTCVLFPKMILKYFIG